MQTIRDNIEGILADYPKQTLKESCKADFCKGYFHRLYKKKLSKSIMDQLNTVLAQHYGFTEGKLNFIINYDIKCRMGSSQQAYAEGRLIEVKVVAEDEED